jgi:hypothetical protein
MPGRTEAPAAGADEDTTMEDVAPPSAQRPVDTDDPMRGDEEDGVTPNEEEEEEEEEEPQRVRIVSLPDHHFSCAIGFLTVDESFRDRQAQPRHLSSLRRGIH